MTGRMYCPTCNEWREVSLQRRSDDGVTRACYQHRRTRPKTIGRRWPDANGYVRIQTKEGVAYEHRLVWETAHGPIPTGWHVHHKNHDRADNRLENLEARPAFEHNSEHSAERHRSGALVTRGPASPRYRHDLDDTEIVRRRDAGESFRSIGRDLGVSHNVVANHYRRSTA